MKGSIKKRGSTYSYIVDIGRDPLTNKRQQKMKGGFTRKKDAQEALRKVLMELDEKRFIKPSDEQMHIFLENWFTSHYKKGIKESTSSSRNYTLVKHLIKENPLAKKPISQISTEDIDAFYNMKMDNGYSASNIRKMHQLLNQAFKQAVKWKKLSFNPVAEADPPSVKKVEMIIWALDEIHSFLETCKKERHYITFLLAIYTGMRRGELLGMKWNDIDFKRRVIHVKRTLTHIPNEGYLLTTPKTKHSIRQVPIPDYIVNELKSHKIRQDTIKQRLGVSYQDQDLVICTDTGSSQDPRNVLRVLVRICKQANVTKIRFHDIRHTHASILLSQGVDVVKISKRLGHSSPKITLETYAHLMPNEQDEVADIFHVTMEKKKREQNVSKSL